MSIFKLILSLLFSQRGEGEGEGGDGGDGADSGDGQGDQAAAAAAGEGQGGEGAKGAAPTLEDVLRERDDFKTKFETLKGQSGATERNLASERKALENLGYKILRDAEGNVQLVPSRTQTKSRFTDEHKSKFYSYFPDQAAGEGFMGLMSLYMQDFWENNIGQYDQKLNQKSQFQAQQVQSNERMLKLYPSLNSEHETFNQAFYDKASEIYLQGYRGHANGELLAAHEAAIELGISPTAVAAAKKEGFQKGKEAVGKIVGKSPQGQSGAGAGGGGFRKIPFSEYSKLSVDAKAKYDQDELASRGTKK